jgi:hypothetical protein
MRSAWLLSLVVLGCAAKPVDDGADASTSTSGDGDGDTIGPVDSDGPPTPADYAALCEMQVDRSACEAVPHEQYPSQVTWCAWSVEVPVVLDAGGACGFGQPTAACTFVMAGDLGCASDSVACGSAELGWSRVEGDQLVIGRGDVCTSGLDVCDVAEDGTVLAGVPECACLCDAGFPGA